jgi:tRNA 5-methylaminomethyl-2-thiouridine biosynthesis bifunctional protein
VRPDRPRLPPRPDLSFKPDGTPVSTRHDDIYFTAGDGLEEARAVFLKGMGLPERWTGQDRFVILETGFGTGLNFLAAWDLWRRHRPSPTARLIWISLEGYPMTRQDAARALAPFEEVGPLAEQLLAVWPNRARGVQARTFAEEGVRLILTEDEALPALEGLRCRADAVALDGFAPARNADLWSPAVLGAIAARTAPGAPLATFTVASAVRKGLAEAGFTAEKRPGHGRKRDRLEAIRHASPQPLADPLGLDQALTGRNPGRVAIIGAGLAGASVASAFLARGVVPHVFESASAPATKASGNRLGLAMPRLDGADGPMARALVEAWMAADHVYSRLGDTILRPVRVDLRSKTDTNGHKFSQLLADPPIEGLEPLDPADPEAGLVLPGYVVRPEALVRHMLRRAEVQTGAGIDRLEQGKGGWRLVGEAGTCLFEADTVILAGGAELIARFGLDWLPMTGRFGQVESFSQADSGPVRAVTSGDYLIEMEGETLFGASFSAHDPGDPLIARDADRSRNLGALAALDPPTWTRAKQATLTSRVGVRATLPDRMAVIGPVPDAPAYLKAFEGLEKGQTPNASAPVLSGLYICGGFGARGLLWGPYAGDLAASEAFGEPVAASLSARSALAPARFLYRGLKRGTINAR